MRLLRALAPLACLLAVIQTTQPPATAHSRAQTPKRLPGPQDVVYAKLGDANYAYGPGMGQINQRLAALGANANSATINVTYDASFGAWSQQAQDAYQAAVNIWQQVVTSPGAIPINVIADFDSQGFGSLQL